MPELVMPRLSDSMEEATVVEWLKQVGDAVRAGDEVAMVETDKATVACEATDAGVLTEILAEPGTCDHRILYGADAARVIARVRELLEAPLVLMYWPPS
jgi:pyruvate/2-oxoglutarate dehydrogenase complex dihydrolipoamide acyltransferase (E2) component